LDGEVVGDPPGFQFFTVGQRKGLGIPMGKKMYVVDIDPLTNTVTLGDEKDLYRRHAKVGKINWLSIKAPAEGATLRGHIKIRHTHEPAAGEIRIEADHAVVTFDEPQKMVTPGQGAAFYDGDVLLGGGWIDKAWN
jgi:tRNA-specific 2-thiouridylase